MTCRELTEFLSAYVYNHLPDDVRRRFDAHVVGCPECAAYLRSYAATVKLVKGAFDSADDPVPDDVPEDLVKAIITARRKT